jgi:predicted HTH domain antitoxin
MNSIALELPEDSALALKLPPEAFAAEVRLVAAMKLYELGRLSSGAAAHLAGVPKPVFLTRLADYGVPSFTQTEAELLEELSHA